ncbi:MULTISPECIES: cobalamin B12-binding domain-containing protein [Rhodopseudomonas]|nr:MULTISPECIES: cobalamin B12-binding domain-containing protein [Rhodopseudomonas]
MFANSCGLPEGGSTLEVQQFVLLTLGSDEAAALLHVETLISQGTTPELIFLNLLAPTARRLSEMCDSDAIDSVTVTLAICRLQEIVRHLGDAFPVNNRGIGGEVLLTTIPGNQLSLEMTMVAELFYRDGWAVRSMPFRPLGDLFSLIGECWFEVIGLWVTSDRRPDELKRYIQDVRRRSRNPKVGIMLGGPTLTRRPDLSASVGADVAAAEGDSAPRLARELVAALKAGK